MIILIQTRLFTDIPYSLSITFPVCTVYSDCNKILAKTLKLLGSSDTVQHSALNGSSVNEPPDLCILSNVSLEMTPSVYNV